MPLADGCVRVPRQAQSYACHFKSTWTQVCRPVHHVAFLCRVRHSMHARCPIAYWHDPRDERPRLHVLAQAYMYISVALQAINLLRGLPAPRCGRVCTAAVAPRYPQHPGLGVVHAGSCAGLLSRVILPHIPAGGGVFRARERGPCRWGHCQGQLFVCTFHVFVYCSTSAQ